MTRLFAAGTLALVSAAPALAQADIPAVGASLIAPAVPVADLDRSARFYATALGLVPGATLHHGALTETVLCADSARGRPVVVLLSGGATQPDGGIAKVIVRVADVTAAAARLRAAGYAAGEPSGGDHRPPVLLVRDPDGHAIEMVGEVAEPSRE